MFGKYFSQANTEGDNGNETDGSDDDRSVDENSLRVFFFCLVLCSSWFWLYWFVCVCWYDDVSMSINQKYYITLYTGS